MRCCHRTLYSAFLTSAVYSKTQMHLFNKRQDVEYYEVGVFDAEWNPVPFVTGYRIIRLEYLEQVKFDVYILKDDADRAEFVCFTF